MEALMPGPVDAEAIHALPPQSTAISIKGLTPGVAYTLAECCHPVPGDRIVGLRRPGQGIEVHSIDCNRLVDGEDVDWVDLAWGDDSEGGTERISVEVKNGPGALGVLATVIGAQPAKISKLTTEEGRVGKKWGRQE